jgi:hypothetical protein
MFSVTAFYWGNEENLKTYAEHCKQYTDDIVIAYIDLFGGIPKIDGINIIPFDHKYLLDNGHSKLMNIVDDHCKYDWTFHLAVGKRISWFNQDLFNSPHSDIAGFGSKEKNNDKDIWSNFHNKKRSKWIKTVHEAIFSNDGFKMSMDLIIEWERIGQSEGYQWEKQYYFKDEKEKIICHMYRQLSRIKWVALEEINPHPARDLAIKKYEEHMSAYNMGREELYAYLLENDLNATM